MSAPLDEGISAGSVVRRIDRGNAECTIRSRPAAGRRYNATTFLSGDLDEWRIDEIVRAGAPVDGFGVGTALSTVNDAPSLGEVYKLVEIERVGLPVGVMKRKQTYPGRKQAWRTFDGHAVIQDAIRPADHDSPSPSARPLLACVMRKGRRLGPQAGPAEGL